MSMSPREQKQKAGALAIGLQVRLRALYEAQNGGSVADVQNTAVPLAALMNENVEFVIYAMKRFAGMSVPPPESEKPTVTLGNPPPMPSLLRAGADVDLPKR